ncbi:MAG: hypothetical protein VX642_12960 [Bdellovibrionota bacterium]|nr:hypothetical protein [Bdellovibrionota bacterium]
MILKLRRTIAVLMIAGAFSACGNDNAKRVAIGVGEKPKEKTTQATELENKSFEAIMNLAIDARASFANSLLKDIAAKHKDSYPNIDKITKYDCGTEDPFRIDFKDLTETAELKKAHYALAASKLLEKKLVSQAEVDNINKAAVAETSTIAEGKTREAAATKSVYSIKSYMSYTNSVVYSCMYTPAEDGEEVIKVEFSIDTEGQYHAGSFNTKNSALYTEVTSLKSLTLTKGNQTTDLFDNDEYKKLSEIEKARSEIYNLVEAQ